MFYLTLVNLAKFLKDDHPTIKENALYKVYGVKKMSKELWTSSDQKYKNEDTGAKKFLVTKFLNFVMVDSKLVVNQVQELQLIIHGILAEGMVTSESFQVIATIEKLPPAWNDFKNYLKHKRKEISMEDLIVRFRIEEDNRGTGKNLNKAAKVNGAKTNVVEIKKDFKKGKQPQNGSKLGPKSGVSNK
ncbi:hypothetical protein J1N35_014556 [Gossypium stocksii]|uniref:Uncharacterized protein n=1 Tax=Gossypium stocksii TaxID=47602 RepID=A0A9D3VV13_9ROSI|nr:hypothetical protein J1N35_014556 [Gossypium stocksii]